MENIFKTMRKKMTNTIITLVSAGILMIILGVLIVWTNFVLKLIMGLLVLVIAYVFFYLAVRIWIFKRELDKFFKF